MMYKVIVNVDKENPKYKQLYKGTLNFEITKDSSDYVRELVSVGFKPEYSYLDDVIEKLNRYEMHGMLKINDERNKNNDDKNRLFYDLLSPKD